MKTVETSHIYIIFLAAITSLVSGIASAHHSYSIYDIDNKISRTGLLTELKFTQPHITMQVEVVHEDGAKELWKVASMGPSLWDRNGHDREFAQIGDTITIQGWPARNGNDEMALSIVISEKMGKMVIRDIVRQSGARDNIPDTIKRE